MIFLNNLTAFIMSLPQKDSCMGTKTRNKAQSVPFNPMIKRQKAPNLGTFQIFRYQLGCNTDIKKPSIKTWSC